MKRTLLLSALAAMIAVSCSTTPENGNIEFATAKAERTFRLDAKSDDSPKSEISLSVVYAKGDSKKARAINDTISQWLLGIKGIAMQQAVDSFVNTRGNNYIKDFAELYRQDKANSADQGAWYQAHYELATHTEQNADTIVNYIAELDTYDGGAHGLHTKYAMNFSTNSGRLTTLDDVLLPGYRTRLNEILLDKLMKHTGTRDIDGLKEKGYLQSMDMCPSQFYVINAKGITFIYNQYEIAPYAVGITELMLTWDDMKAIAKDRKD